MRLGQVIVGLHFGQAACGALEFEAEPLAGVHVWIDKAEYRNKKVDYYDRKDSLLKIQVFSDYQLYLDKYWRAHTMTMDNQQNGKSTTLHWRNFKFQTGLTDDDFKKNDLKRQR